MHFPSAMRLLKGSADFALDLISLLINQTTKHQRASSRTRYNPKIIIYSSSIPNEWKDKLGQGGVDEFLEKTGSLSALKEKLVAVFLRP